MADVQNIGAVDYAQYQPVINQQIPEEYNNAAPAMYEPEMAEKRRAASGMTGLTIAAIVGAVTAGLITHKMCGKKAKIAEEKLNELKNSEAYKNYTKLKEAAQNIEKTVDNADKFSIWKPKTWGTAALVSKIKDLLKPAKEGFEDTSKKAAEEAKEAAGEAKKAAEEAAEDAAK